jgi:Holliday junction resolvase
MLESKLQARLIKQYEKEGYYIIKIIRANKSGIPDLLLIKDGMASWVEVKSSNGVVSEMQKIRAEQLRKAGCDVKFVNPGGEDVKYGMGRRPERTLPS